jgi:hypothetical protein
MLPRDLLNPTHAHLLHALRFTAMRRSAALSRECPVPLATLVLLTVQRSPPPQHAAAWLTSGLISWLTATRDPTAGDAENRTPRRAVGKEEGTTVGR